MAQQPMMMQPGQIPQQMQAQQIQTGQMQQQQMVPGQMQPMMMQPGQMPPGQMPPGQIVQPQQQPMSQQTPYVQQMQPQQASTSSTEEAPNQVFNQYQYHMLRTQIQSYKLIIRKEQVPQKMLDILKTKPPQMNPQPQINATQTNGQPMQIRMR